MSTVWTLRCRYCDVEFTAPAARPYCSLLCSHRHHWYGTTVPDAHRRFLSRVSRP